MLTPPSSETFCIIKETLLKLHYHYGNSSQVRHHFTCNFISISEKSLSSNLLQADGSSCSSFLVSSDPSDDCLFLGMMWNFFGAHFKEITIWQPWHNESSIIWGRNGFSDMYSHCIAGKNSLFMEMSFFVSSLHLTVKYSGPGAKPEWIIPVSEKMHSVLQVLSLTTLSTVFTCLHYSSSL